MSIRSMPKTTLHQTPAEIITYRLDQDLVYITPPGDHDQAVKFAQDVFPTLSDVRTEDITFLINVKVGGTPKKVRIAPMAWKKVVSALKAYEIVDVVVQPSFRATKSDTSINTYAYSDAPPKYPSSHLDVPSVIEDRCLSDNEKQFFTMGNNSSDVPEPHSRRSRSAIGWLTKRL